MVGLLQPVPPLRRAVFPFYDTNVSLTSRAGKDRYGEQVPKRVDHEERRQQIAYALLRTAAARGLHATGMREVAAEAGVSLRLVQYYFGTKEELLLAAMQHLAARFAARAAARFKEAVGSGGPANPRDVIAAILAEALPADDERRTFHVIYTAYLALSLTDPALAIAPLVKNSDTVIDVVAAQLRAAQAAGDTPTHLDPDLEAFSLMAMSAGLATSVLAGQSSTGQAQAVIDYHLDHLFASRPALRRGSMNIAGTGRRAVQSSPRPEDAAVTTDGQGGGLAGLSSGGSGLRRETGSYRGPRPGKPAPDRQVHRSRTDTFSESLHGVVDGFGGVAEVAWERGDAVACARLGVTPRCRFSKMRETGQDHR
jgi:AcrR family transcriptional regulator